MLQAATGVLAWSVLVRATVLGRNPHDGPPAAGMSPDRGSEVGSGRNAGGRRLCAARPSHPTSPGKTQCDAAGRLSYRSAVFNVKA